MTMFMVWADRSRSTAEAQTVHDDLREDARRVPRGVDEVAQVRHLVGLSQVRLRDGDGGDADQVRAEEALVGIRGALRSAKRHANVPQKRARGGS